MKTNKISKIFAATMLAGAPLLWTACSDTWSEHYDALEGGMTDQPSLLDNIASDASLSNFLKVIKSVGAADSYNSPQQLTVWAPLDFSAAQADSVIAIFEADRAQGLKYEDNRAITQFLQNHTALYTRQVSSLTDDTIKMLNNKYMRLVGTSATSGSLENNPFNEMVLCNNGILYKTQHIQNFYPNIREYLEKRDGQDSLINMLKFYDEYELNESASVPGGIKDGKTIYLDSVTVLTNEMLQRYGYIQREDSSYIFLAPNDEVWQKSYEQFSQYYNYANSVPKKDSLQTALTQQSILSGRFFNVSKDNPFNKYPQDSLCSTTYREQQRHYPRTNVYYQPQTTILAGLEKIQCSNGSVYVDNKGVIDPRSTFFTRLDMDASQPFFYELPKDSKNETTMNASNITLTVSLADEVITDEEGNETVVSSHNRNYNYVQVTAVKSTDNTSIEYKIPSTLSGCYYNMYLVTIPDIYSANPLPTWFQCLLSTLNEKGAFPAKGTNLKNPNPITADSDVENADVIAKQSNSDRCFVADAMQIDTVLIQSAVQFPYSGAGLDDGTVKLTVQSFGPSSSSYREKIYSRTLRLNEIILVPFETKEEAEEAAHRTDLFNDDRLMLEAKK